MNSGLMIVHIKEYNRSKQRQQLVVFFRPPLTSTQQNTLRKYKTNLQIEYETVEDQLGKATVIALGRDEANVGQQLLIFLDKVSKQLKLKPIQGT